MIFRTSKLFFHQNSINFSSNNFEKVAQISEKCYFIFEKGSIRVLLLFSRIYFSLVFGGWAKVGPDSSGGEQNLCRGARAQAKDYFYYKIKVFFFVPFETFICDFLALLVRSRLGIGSGSVFLRLFLARAEIRKKNVFSFSIIFFCPSFALDGVFDVFLWFFVVGWLFWVYEEGGISLNKIFFGEIWLI